MANRHLAHEETSRTMKSLRVHLASRSYPIVVGRGAIRYALTLLRQRKHPVNTLCIVTTSIVRRLHGERFHQLLEHRGYPCKIVVIPDTESSKSITQYQRLLKHLILYRASSQSILIALGGGVVGDLVGFTAATFKRGIPYLQIPTTLLAQVDSAIGGKTAIDLPAGKNLVGAFYQPIGVISDTDCLGTLPTRQLRSGLAEVVKYGILGDPTLFRYVERHTDQLLSGTPEHLAWIVIRCAMAKARLVEQDEYDRRNIRMALNLGHTIGHAIEAAAAYSRRYDHGQAVAIGMVGAARLSQRLNLCSSSTVQRLTQLLRQLKLPIACPKVPPSSILAAMHHDKKFTSSGNRFVLPTRIGHVVIRSNIPDHMIHEVVCELAQAKPPRS